MVGEDSSPAYGRLYDTLPNLQTSDFLESPTNYCGYDPLLSKIGKSYFGKYVPPSTTKRFLNDLLHLDVGKRYDLPEGIGGATEIKSDENGSHPGKPYVNGNAPEWLQKYSGEHEKEHCSNLEEHPYLIYGFIARYGEELGMMLYEGLTDYMTQIKLVESDPKLANAGRKASGYKPFVNIYEDLAKPDLYGIMDYFNEIGKEYADKVYGQKGYAEGLSAGGKAYPVYPIEQSGECGSCASCC